jgi:CMP-N,N'-diacetyllegionaminic acid synthase
MNRKKITAVVPVRKGSQRIINKNFKKFANKNLLEIKLDILTQINIIDEIIVNTDSELALDIADKYGVSKFKRESYFATSKCNNSEFFHNMAETTDTDYLIYSPCTAPLILEGTYYDFINRFINCLENGYDSLTTVVELKHHMWLDGKPLNYDPIDSPNTQDLPDILKLTYGISMIPKKIMIENRNIIGNNPMFYRINDFEGIDIDNQVDFDFAEFIYNRDK